MEANCNKVQCQVNKMMGQDCKEHEVRERVRSNRKIAE